MNTNQIRQLIKNLQIIMRCPKCGKKYNLEEIFLKGYSGDTYFLQLNCSNCRTPVSATIAITGNMAEIAKANVGKIQDLTGPLQQRTEEQAKTQKTKITTDDIIEMHQFLKEFQGNFSNLF